MGIFRQIGQLLWKNILLRKREPHVLLLEILWPLVIFIIVALIRTAMPPTEKPTCSYPERPMPSAGMLPFLQSSACSLQNQCEDPSAIKNKQQSAAKLSALISDLEPYITNPKTLDALATVNISVKVAKGLKDMTSNTSTDSGMLPDLGGDDFTVRKFFRDADKVYTMLVSEMKIMTPDVATAFLNSSLNVLSILDLFDQKTGLKTIACDVNLLTKYVIFKQGVDVNKVSKVLCDIDENKIPEITDFIQTQLDIAAIIRMAKSLTALTNNYELSDAMEDMATMTDMLYGSSTIGAMLQSSESLKNLPALMEKLPMIMNAMTNLQSLNTKEIEELMSFVKPMLESMFPGSTASWNSTEYLIKQFNEISAAIGNGENTNWTDVMSKGLELANTTNMIDQSLLSIFSGMPMDALTNFTTAFLSGNMEQLENMTVADMMMFIQSTLEQTLGRNSTVQILVAMDAGVDMSMVVANYFNDLEMAVRSVMNQDTASVQNIMDKLKQMGPNVTMSVWQMFLDSRFITKLLSQPYDSNRCKELTGKSLASLGQSMLNDIQNIVCNDSITALINRIIALSDSKEMQKQIEAYAKIMEMAFMGQIPVTTPISLITVYNKMMNVSQMYGKLMHGSSVVYWLDTTYSMATNVTMMTDWNVITSYVAPKAIELSWPTAVVTVGSVVENTTMWTMLGPMMVTVDMTMDYAKNVMQSNKDMADQSTVMGKMLKYAVDYSPEIMTAVMSMDNNMMQMLMSNVDDVPGLFCDKKILSQMGMPSYVPVSDMESTICNTDWNKVGNDMVSTYDMTPMMQEVELYFSGNQTLGKYDWEGMVYKTQDMLGMLQDPQALSMAGPWSVISSANMSRLQDGMMIMMRKMANMSDPNNMMSSLNGNIISTLYQLDASMQNVTEWRLVQRYALTMNAALKMYINYYNQLYQGPVNLQQYLMNMSKTFGEFVTKSVTVMPDFFQLLSNTSVNPMMFVTRLMTVNTSDICSGNMFTELLGISAGHALSQYQQYVCKLNWTAILMELAQSDPYIQDYMAQIEILAMDWTKMPAVTVDWNDLFNNMMKYMDAIASMDLSKVTIDTGGFNLDVNRLNMTWENMAKSLMSLDNLKNLGSSSDAFMSLMQGIFPTSDNSSDLFNQLQDMQNLYLYQMYAVNNFMIIHLEYIDKMGSLNLKTYVNSPELNKILNQVAASPDITAVGLQTILDSMSDMRKSAYIMSSWDKLCSNSTLFNAIFKPPAGSSIDMTTLQSGICGLNLNFTVLMSELMSNLRGMPEMMQALMATKFDANTMMSVNYSAIQSQTETLQELFGDLTKYPPTIVLGVGDNRWMNMTVYEQMYTSFIEKLTSWDQMNMMQLQNTGFESLSGLTAIPEFNMIMQYVTLYIDEYIKSINRTKASAQDHLVAYNGFPNLQKVMELADDLPYIVAAWNYNYLFYQYKMTNLLMVQSWDQFCALDDKVLPVNVPGSDFSVSNFKKELCMVNITALMIEGAQYQGVQQTIDLAMNNNTKPADISKLSAQITKMMELMASLQNVTEMDIPDYMNETVWNMANNELAAALSDPQLLMKMSTLVMENVDALFKTSPELAQMQKEMNKMFYGVVGVILDKLDLLSNDSVIDIGEMLSKSPETLKLWNILQKPGVLEVLLYSANTAKFQNLLMKTNMTEVMLLLCHPTTGSLSNFLTVPAGSKVDLSQLQQDVCSVRMDLLPAEIMNDISKIVMLLADNTTSVNATAVAARYLKLESWLTKWATNPPVIKLPALWQNVSYWINMMEKYNQATMDPATLSQQMEAMLVSLQPMLDQEPFKSYGIVMEAFLNLMTQQLAVMTMTNMTLEDIGKQVPVVADLFSMMNISTDLLQTLMLTPVTSPDELMKLLMSADPLQVMCDSDGFWSKTFKVPSDSTIAMMKQQICNGTQEEMIMSLLAKWKMSDLIMAMTNNNTNVKPDWAKIMMKSTEMSELLTKLMEANPMNMFNLTQYMASFDHLAALFQKYYVDDIMSWLPMLSNSMNSMTSMMDPDTNKIMHTMNLMATVLMDRISSMQGTLSIEALFRNNTELVPVIKAFLGLDVQMWNAMISGDLNLEKYMQVMTIPGIVQDMCTKKTLISYLFLKNPPPSFAKDLEKILCLNYETFGQVLAKELGVDYVNAELTKIWNSTNLAPIDMNEFNANMNNLTQMLTKLFENPIAIDPVLMDALNFTKLLDSFGKLMQNPDLIFSIVSAINPTSGMTVDPSLVPSLLLWNHVYYELTTSFQIYKDSGNATALLIVLNNLSILNAQVLMGVPLHEIFFANLSEMPGMASLVCDIDKLTKASNADAAKNISSALCGQPADQWLKRLQYTPINQVHGYYIVLMTAATGKSPLSLAWGDYVGQFQNLMQLFGSLNMSSTDELMRILDHYNMINTNNLNVANMINLLKMFGNGSLDSVQGMADTLTEVNKYLNRQLNLLSDTNTAVPITVLLPNNTMIAKLLEQALGPQSAASLLTASLNPDLFMEMAFSDGWAALVCDMTNFKAVFRFPNGTDIVTLQKDLCKDAQIQDSVMKDIIKKLDMADVLTAFDKWMSGASKAIGDEKAMFDLINSQMNQLIATIEKMSMLNVSTKGLDSWLAPVMMTLETLNNPDPQSIGQTCDKMMSYVGNTEMYNNYFLPGMLVAYNNLMSTKQQLEIHKVIEGILCDMKTFNVTEIIRRLKEAKFVEWIIKTSTSDMFAYPVGGFTCSDVVTLSMEVTAMANASMYNSFTKDPWKCAANAFMLPVQLLQDTAGTMKVAAELLELLSDPSIKAMIKDDEMVAFLQYMLQVYIQQSKMTMKLSDLMANFTTMENLLGQTLNLAPEFMAVFFNSTLKMDSNVLFNQSAEGLQAILCDPVKLSQVISLPSFTNISMVDLSKMLCQSNIGSTTELLQAFNELSTLTSQMGANVGDMTYWNKMSANLMKVINNMQELLQITSMTIDIDNLQTLLPYIQRMIMDSGPEVFADSIVVLMEDFKRLDNNTMTRAIITDLQKIVKGMTSLKVVRNFIPMNVVIGDVVKDRAALKRYLMSNLGFSEEMADNVLSSSVLYSELMKYDPKKIQARVCNVTQLDDIMNVTSGNVNSSQISSVLCKLNTEQIVNFTEGILANLDIGKLVKEYVLSGSGVFLEKFNISATDARESLEKLSAAQVDLETAANVFTNKTTEMNLNIFNSPQALSGSPSLSSLSDIICGTQSQKNFDVKDSTGVSKKVSETSTSHLTANQKKEMLEFPDQFCQDMYAEIMKASDGVVIWAYLKPILRGKILVSPNTAATRTLVELMNNMSFGMLSEVKAYTSVWSTGLYEINELKSDTAAVDEIKKLSSSSLASSFVESALGMSLDDVVKGINTLDSFGGSELTQMKNLVQTLDNYLGCLETNRFHVLNTEAELEKKAFEFGEKGQYLAGIVFNNMDDGGRLKRASDGSLPKHISYKIRMDIENVRHSARMTDRYWSPVPLDDMVFDMRYLRGFSQMQDIVDQAIIQLQTGLKPGTPSINLQQFPAPCHKNDSYLNNLAMFLLPVLMTLAWLASMAVSAKNLVYDREHGQEETLKIMGMRSIINWWAWFLVTMLVMAISVLLCILTLRIANMYIYSNFGILFLFFITFCFSSVMLCYMVSSFFTRTSMAVLTVLVVYMISYLPYIILVSLNTQMKFWQKNLACLFSTTAFSYGAQYLAHYEIQMVGVHWNNINDSPIQGDQASLSWMCIMMLIDAAIYLVIGWYVRNVKPGKYGVPQPWYFPVSPYYWGCGNHYSHNKYAPEGSDDILVDSVPESLVVGMSLRGLTKNFGNVKAVKDVNADFYEGQITALLGHNGAAKTTTINMLTGMLVPSKGSVRIYGKSLDKSKNLIGVCCQHNSLFHYMTVMEHMKFFGAVKSNLSKKDLEYEIENLLRDVDLWHVQDTRVTDLSGGMKRRLNVALAFVGGSTAVILDEPTSGVDPQGRRCIWNLISKRKNSCTILISTHHLDEADMIGDRVAIMHDGKLLCCGSPLFLKQKVGNGYHLKIVKMDGCDTYNIMTTLRSWIPGAELVENIGSEMTVLLPVYAATMDRLYKCLHDLDVNKSSLKIGNYGIFDTTMEEVFLKICEVADKNLPLTEETMKSHKGQVTAPEGSIGFAEEKELDKKESIAFTSTFKRQDTRQRVTGETQKWQQFKALLTKRFHHYRRNWRMIISVFIFPLIFMAAAFGFMTIRPDATDAPSVMLTPAMYGPNSYAFYKDDAKDTMSGSMVEHLIANPGLSTTCMADMNVGAPFVCQKTDSKFFLPNEPPKTTGNCTCDDYKYTCNADARLTATPQVRTKTSEILQNIEGHDITEYLLKTHETYRYNRYGGWSFHKDGTNTKALVWFYNRGHHAMPAFYNALSNTILRSSVPSADAAQYGITAYNHPIMLHKQQLTQDTIVQSASDLGISCVMLTALTFIHAGFIIYILTEFGSKERQLEFVSGVGVFIYWITSLLWDLLVYCFTIGLVVVIMAIFQQSAYWDRENLQGAVILMLLFGWAVIPMMYCTNKMFRDSVSGYMFVLCGGVIIGIISVAIVFILQFYSNVQSMEEAYNVIQYVLLIFPQFSLTMGFVALTTNQAQAEIFARFDKDMYVSPFSFDLLLWNYIAMAAEGFFFMIVLFMLEIRCHCKKRLPSPDSFEESRTESEEVSNEKQRVMMGYANDDALVVDNLSKIYKQSKREFLAVNRVSFGVPRGECFGLLGVNGAGKTTTFQMLTGGIPPSDGSATVDHKKVTRGSSNIGQCIGYCPQEDALDPYLSARELLHCHAKLRGIPPNRRDSAVDYLIRDLKMDFADRAIHTYSGGMKRKLCTAIALLGEPPIVFLDEPTTGLDPVSKRLVWNCISNAVKNKQSVILTSHSMEECDALCSRLAIMVNGEFKCLGSPQLLKNKYGDGYTVVIHTSGLSTIKISVNDFINRYLPNAIIRDQHHGVLQLDIPKSTSSVADIIQSLEQEKDNLCISHYSVSQTTLDNVFLNFAREQNDGVEGTDSASGSNCDNDSMTHLSEPFSNLSYAYMNAGYQSKDELFGNPHSAMLMNVPAKGEINGGYSSNGDTLESKNSAAWRVKQPSNETSTSYVQTKDGSQLSGVIIKLPDKENDHSEWATHL